MLFSSITGNSQKLDGGAMFGNAPKAVWERWISVDSLNRIDLATRALLVETENHKVLFEAGIGSYMTPKYRERYGVRESRHVLLDSLSKLGLTHKDITDIILSHLHFDHVGGLFSHWKDGEELELLFPNAKFYVSQETWERSITPHPRDRASFIPSLNEKLKQSGRLVHLTGDEVLQFDELNVSFFRSAGHTPGMLCSDLKWREERLLFAADLIPGTPWIHLPITTGYDRYPEKVIDEKREFLTSVIEDDAWLFFTHDFEIAMSKVVFDKTRNKYRAADCRQEFERVEL